MPQTKANRRTIRSKELELLPTYLLLIRIMKATDLAFILETILRIDRRMITALTARSLRIVTKKLPAFAGSFLTAQFQVGNYCDKIRRNYSWAGEPLVFFRFRVPNTGSWSARAFISRRIVRRLTPKAEARSSSVGAAP